jgi:hypothetical protein
MKHVLTLSIVGSLLMSGTAFAQTDTPFSQKPFTDIPEGSTYFESVEYLRTQNVLKGYLDGTFKPDQRLDRAEFVKFVVNPFILDTNELADCVQKNTSGSSSTVFFPDVAKDAWYAPEVCHAKVKKIIDGYPDGKYRPTNTINFVEAAKILSNVFSLQLANPDMGEFWYRPYVERLADLNAIPTSIKRFDQAITRGEMAEMVYRLKADREDKASASYSSIQ